MNLNNKWKKTAAVLALVCMTGCGAKGLEGDFAEMADTENVETRDNQQDVSSLGEVQAEAGQMKKDELTLLPELFDGTGMRIWNGKGNTLLALKEDTLYLYDVESARIKARAETELSDAAVLYPCKDGYFAIDWTIKGEPEAETLDDGSMLMEVDGAVEYLGIFFDDSLKETRKILLNDIVENPECDVWTVSSDGSMLGYYDPWDGLNLYDLNSQKKQNLLKVEMEETGARLLGINALFFEEGKSGIVFTGQTDQNGSTFASWGRISMDGTGFENHMMERDFGTAVGYHDGKLLIGEDSIFYKGGVAFVDVETEKAVYYTDIDRDLPISGPYFSADGTVFATAALDTEQMEISIYSTADFSLLYKETIKDDREEMFYRSPQICLFPEIQTCIVSMGGHNDIPQKTVLLI